MGTDKPLLNFVIDPELLERVDTFRFKHRFNSRAAAIKWLLEAALDAKLLPPENIAATTDFYKAKVVKHKVKKV